MYEDSLSTKQSKVTADTHFEIIGIHQCRVVGNLINLKCASIVAFDKYNIVNIEKKLTFQQKPNNYVFN